MIPPRARLTDPETSHAAARSVQDLTAKRRAVLYVFRDGNSKGLTDSEMVDRYTALSHSDPLLFPPQSDSGLRTRRHELVEGGHLVDSGARLTLPSGRRAILWSIPPMLPGQQGSLL